MPVETRLPCAAEGKVPVVPCERTSSLTLNSCELERDSSSYVQPVLGACCRSASPCKDEDGREAFRDTSRIGLARSDLKTEADGAAVLSHSEEAEPGVEME